MASWHLVHGGKVTRNQSNLSHFYSTRHRFTGFIPLHPHLSNVLLRLPNYIVHGAISSYDTSNVIIIINNRSWP
jgi:hypothetical protein